MHGGCSRLPWGGAVAACAPRCRSLCCRLMASALFGMRAAPSRRNGGPRPSSALPLNRAPPPASQMAASAGGKSLRPAAGFRCAPCARWPPSSVASGGGVVSRQPPLSSSRSGGASAQPPSPPPSPPASLCAGNQGGGLLQRPLAAAPLRRRAPSAQPRPPVLAPGRGYFGFAAAGLGIAPPAGGAKGLPSCTRCAM